MNQTELRPVLSGTGTETIEGTNYGCYPLHSYLHFDSSRYPVPSLLTIPFAGDDIWVEGCFRRRRNSRLFVVEFVYAGNMVFTQGNHEYLAEPGQAFLVQPGKTSTMSTGPEGFCRKIAVRIDGPALNGMLLAAGLATIDLVEPTENPVRFMDLLNGAVKALKSQTDSTAQELSAAAFRILDSLSRYAGNTSALPAPLKKAIDLVLNKLECHWTLPMICTECGASASALTRHFRHHFGMAPMAYVIGQRMTRANHLLTTTSLSVKEIAGRCGYTNPLYFSMEFSRRNGMSPSIYRKSHLE